MKKTSRYYVKRGKELLSLVGMMACGDIGEDGMPYYEDKYGLKFSEWGDETDLLGVIHRASAEFLKAIRLARKGE